MLLAIGAVRQHLVRTGPARAGRARRRGRRRLRHPPLRLPHRLRRRGGPPLARAGHGRVDLRRGGSAEEADRDAAASPTEAVERYRAAAEKGLLKILSKMGISTLSSYCGAQIFEALGLGREVIDAAFSGTASPIGGIGFEEIAEDVVARHAAAYAAAQTDRDCPTTAACASARKARTTAGRRQVSWRCRRRRRAARRTTRPTTASWRSTGARRPAGPRDLLGIRSGHAGATRRGRTGRSDRRRFVSSAMSLGALSPEAHATLAIAMNRMGAQSNSGEGGEDPHFYRVRDRRRPRRQQHQAGRLGALRRHRRVPGARRGAGDQDRPGRQARRRRPAARPQGHRADRAAAPCGTGHPPDLAAAAPRHLLHRGPGAAHLRPEDGESAGPRRREAGRGGRRGHRRRRRLPRPTPTTSSSPATTAAPAHRRCRRSSTPARPGSWAWPRPSNAGAERPAAPDRGAHRRRAARPGATWSSRRCSAPRVTASARRRWSPSAAPWRGSATSIPAPPASPPSATTCAPSSRARRSRSSPTSRSWPRRCARSSPRWVRARSTRSIGRTDLLVRVERPDVPRAQLLDLSMLLAPRQGRALGDAAAHRGAQRPAGTGLARRRDHRGAARRTSRAACRSPATTRSATTTSRSAPGVSGEIARAVWRCRAARGNGPAPLHGQRRPEFRGLPLQGVHLELEGEANDYVGKGLCGRRDHHPALPARGLRGQSHQHLLGNTALYGATGGLLFAAGQAGRPLRGAQLRGHGRGRGRRRPLLRIHDGRHRGGPRARGAQLRRRDVQRARVRAR